MNKHDVMKALSLCGTESTTCTGCPYHGMNGCDHHMCDDALSLLQSNDTKPTYHTAIIYTKHTNLMPWLQSNYTKFGAHGTSIRYVSKRTAEIMGKDLKELKMIICHLGSGASVTAVKDGKCYDTSMGFSPLAGITMGTRSGDVDPSVLQHIMKMEGMTDFNEMISILNRKSGLLGISGLSSDMRDISANADKNPRARLAREIFINRIVRYIGGYAAEMNGVDAIVFTAGIGEHSDIVRAGVLKNFGYLGLKFDAEANKTNGEKFISTPDSKVAALIVPTDEELMIERDVVRLTHLK